MANVQLNQGSGGPFVATNPITRDNVTEQMELVNLADSSSGDCATIDGNGLHVYQTNGNAQNSSGTGQQIIAADSTFKIDIPANSSVTLNGVAGKQIRVTFYLMIASEPAASVGTPGTVQFIDATTSTPLSGAMAVDAETGISAGSGLGVILILPPGDSLEIATASGASVQGHLAYTIC